MQQSTLVPEKIVPPFFSKHLTQERYQRFLLQASSRSDTHYIVISFPFSCDDPLQWFSTNRKSFSFNYYWEKPASSFTIAALGNKLELSASGRNRFKNIQQSLAKANKKIVHFNTGDDNTFDIHFAGGFSFFDDHPKTSWKSYKPALLTLPKYTIVKNEGCCMASIALSMDEPMDPGSLHQKISEQLHGFTSLKVNRGASFSPKPNLIIPEKRYSSGTDYKKWEQLVSDAKQNIGRKEFEKIVLGRQLRLPLTENFEPVSALHHLRTHYPQCYTFLWKNRHSPAFIGSTPELLLSVQGNCMQTEALAGSIARGATKTDDKQLEDKLLESFKNNEEHRYVVEDIKKLLAPFAKHLHSACKPRIKKLSNVQHLYTPIAAEIEKRSNPLLLLGQLHPTPAVGGTPRNHALSYIRRNESFNRGWFASPVGWITPNQDTQFAVAIRSGLINKNFALLFAGCGIVADSDPKIEWQEANLKFSPMLSALNYD